MFQEPIFFSICWRDELSWCLYVWCNGERVSVFTESYVESVSAKSHRDAPVAKDNKESQDIASQISAFRIVDQTVTSWGKSTLMSRLVVVDL